VDIPLSVGDMPGRLPSEQETAAELLRRPRQKIDRYNQQDSPENILKNTPPSIAPGIAVKAKNSPDRKSIRFRRRYAIEPDKALKKATVSVMLVIVAGVSSG
jgi:hypothetical protein